ncbi:hypothetical protein HYS85_01060, partial [Candidatus Saccharibacteria bacterium]|nr:hypothetical protein [Candidatus Saccharibacteria bacterium]
QAKHIATLLVELSVAHDRLDGYGIPRTSEEMGDLPHVLQWRILELFERWRKKWEAMVDANSERGAHIVNLEAELDALRSVYKAAKVWTEVYRAPTETKDDYLAWEEEHGRTSDDLARAVDDARERMER